MPAYLNSYLLLRPTLCCSVLWVYMKGKECVEPRSPLARAAGVVGLAAEDERDERLLDRSEAPA